MILFWISDANNVYTFGYRLPSKSYAIFHFHHHPRSKEANGIRNTRQIKHRVNPNKSRGPKEKGVVYVKSNKPVTTTQPPKEIMKKHKRPVSIHANKPLVSYEAVPPRKYQYGVTSFRPPIGTGTKTLTSNKQPPKQQGLPWPPPRRPQRGTTNLPLPPTQKPSMVPFVASDAMNSTMTTSSRPPRPSPPKRSPPPFTTTKPTPPLTWSLKRPPRPQIRPHNQPKPQPQAKPPTSYIAPFKSHYVIKNNHGNHEQEEEEEDSFEALAKCSPNLQLKSAFPKCDLCDRGHGVIGVEAMTSFGRCLIDYYPHTKGLTSKVTNAEKVVSFDDDNQCTVFVKDFFSLCAGLIPSCSLLLGDEDKAVPVLGCLFAKYPDLMVPLISLNSKKIPFPPPRMQSQRRHSVFRSVP